MKKYCFILIILIAFCSIAHSQYVIKQHEDTKLIGYQNNNGTCYYSITNNFYFNYYLHILPRAKKNNPDFGIKLIDKNDDHGLKVEIKIPIK